VPVSRRKPYSARVAARQDRNRAEILAVARQLLIKGSVAEFTLDGVAKALGVTKPAIYHYFASRRALVSATMAHGFAEHAGVLLEAARAADEGPAVLRALTTAFVNHYRVRLEEFRLDFAWTQINRHPNPSEVRSRILPVMNEMVTEVAAKLRRGMPMPPKRARRLCVVAWFTGVGLVSALSVTEANGTNLAHSTLALLGEINGLFKRGV
jgi:AcrR family transcriptional regulator